MKMKMISESMKQKIWNEEISNETEKISELSRR